MTRYRNRNGKGKGKESKNSPSKNLANDLNKLQISQQDSFGNNSNNSNNSGSSRNDGRRRNGTRLTIGRNNNGNSSYSDKNSRISENGHLSKQRKYKNININVKKRKGGSKSNKTDSSEDNNNKYDSCNPFGDGNEWKDCNESENENESDYYDDYNKNKNKNKSKKKSTNKRNRNRNRDDDFDDGDENKTEEEGEGEEFEDMDDKEKMRSNIIKMKEMLLTQEFDFEVKGRENEYNKIWNFFIKHLECGKGGSYYVCGSPGTGKSATLFNIERKLSSFEIRKKYNISLVYKLNAMSLSTPNSIYTVLYEKCFNKNTNRNTNKNVNISARNAVTKLDSYFVNNGNMKIVIIDEMDGLLGQHQTVLYQLFSWCQNNNSKLILIGIANSIDLTDRFLPKLRQRQIAPKLLIFEPYTKQQLMTILIYRLNILTQNRNGNANGNGNRNGSDNNSSNNNNSVPYFEKIALQLCSQKVAKQYGDVRKCLEICRACLDLLISKIDNCNHDSSNINDIKLSIGFIEMNKILKESFGSPIIEIIQNLPNHQTIVLVIAALLAKYNSAHSARTPFVLYTKVESPFVFCVFCVIDLFYDFCQICLWILFLCVCVCICSWKNFINICQINIHYQCHHHGNFMLLLIH